MTISSDGSSSDFNKSIFEYIREELKKYKQPKLENLPDFTGGIVGYLGYENISLIESVINFSSNGFDNPDSILGMYNTILAFDHHRHQIILISNVKIDNQTNLEAAYNKAKSEINKLRNELRKPVEYSTDFQITDEINENFNPEEFYKQVEAGKNNIVEGDIFQIVLSKRFSSNYTGDLFNVYRALRIINPSPYMYYPGI